MSVRLGQFMELSHMTPTTQFAHRRGLGTCDALLCVHVLHIAKYIQEWAGGNDRAD